VVFEPSLLFDALNYLEKPDREMLADIGVLRKVAWNAFGALPIFGSSSEEVWLDSHDDHAHHWVIRRGDILVASGRMCIHSTIEAMPDSQCLAHLEGRIELPAASLNRLVVHPDFRGAHLAPLFDQARIEYARKLRAKGVLGVTQPRSRLRDLEGAGFVNLGEAPHRIVSHMPSFVLWKPFELAVGTV